MFRLLFLAFVFIYISQPVSAQLWEISPLSQMPVRVSNNAVCEGFINSKPYVYSFGGIDATKSYLGIHLDSYRYSVETDQWESIAPLPDTLGKIAAAASRVGDIIYVIGGYHVFANQDEVSSDRVHRYDVLNNTYLADGAPIPVPIDDQVQAVWRDSLIYVVTGWSDGENVSDVQIYNPATNTWLVGTPLPANESYRSFGASGTIIGDTIYYFGGARFGFNFPIQANFRKGVIDPSDPTQINWSISIPNGNRKGYRMAATAIDNQAFWIGGAEQTYNFDGIAYSNGIGVPPANRIATFNAGNGIWSEQMLTGLPMDLRGIASVGPRSRILAGGMLDNQQVTNSTLLLEYRDTTTSTTPINLLEAGIYLFPNPTSSELHIQLDLLSNDWQAVQVLNILGTVVKQQQLSGQLTTINVAGLETGIYAVRLLTKSGASTNQLFIIQR